MDFGRQNFKPEFEENVFLCSYDRGKRNWLVSGL
jgi:hypothetical protein